MKHTFRKTVFGYVLVLTLTLFTLVSSTLAWFTTMRNVEVITDGFQIALPPSQKAELYFLSRNYNDILGLYSGYEEKRLTDQERTEFLKVNPKISPSPTSTSCLWPASSLTYALVFTPYRTGTFSFRIRSWKSKESETKKVSGTQGIRLSWTIGIYAAVRKHSTDFQEAIGCLDQATDRFSSSFENEGEQTQNLLSFEAEDTDTEIALYFSLQFKDDPEVYYSYDTATKLYTKNPNAIEQSNCYENLSFIAERFELIPPQESDV